MVTTTMGVVNRVHCYTTNDRPAVSLCLVLVVSVSCLEKGLVCAAAASNKADHGTSLRGDQLLLAGGKADAGLVCLHVVCDNQAVGPGCSR
eukprot:XP_001704255.1 Hypothetical protein GL50803_31271 [Giardia lamblia ATCC 50803]